MKTEPSPYHFLERPESPVRGNVTADVTNALRQAIVTLELKPGEVLDKGAVCEQLGVSRFPVSEALARLAAEGLVDILPQRGTVVSRIAIADVAEYMLIRKALEGEAVRALAPRHDQAFAQRLAANIEQQRVAASAGDRHRFHAHDLLFHDMLFEALNLDKVRTIIESARANLDRARRLILTPRRLGVTLGEHEVIVTALAARDGERADAAMRAHLDAVMVELVAFARQHPELFADGESTRDKTNNFPLY